MPKSHRALRRELGLPGATFTGIGSILGAGVFVSLGLVAGLSGPLLLAVILAAAGVATCNGLSSAQLAAAHPVSGGAYEYGHVFLQPWLGFIAGLVFLAAKSASAATSALGFAGYLLNALGLDSSWMIPVALGAVTALTLLVLGGLRRSAAVNIIIVSITLLSLLSFILGGLPQAMASADDSFSQEAIASVHWPDLLEAVALMFVAYTGYGRIATMGEEVRQPRRIIPRAIIITLAVTAVLYLSVGFVALATSGAEQFAALTAGSAAPLEIIARRFGLSWLPGFIALGAITAMLGVSLNLILGLSRVLLAMGRRGDAPSVFAGISSRRSTPTAAIIGVGIIIAALTLPGDIRITWSFSAFTVLVYYAINNGAALALPASRRLYHPAIAWTGLASCLFLALWIDPPVLFAGTGVILLGLLVRYLIRSKQTDTS